MTKLNPNRVMYDEHGTLYMVIGYYPPHVWVAEFNRHGLKDKLKQMHDTCLTETDVKALDITQLSGRDFGVKLELQRQANTALAEHKKKQKKTQARR